MARWVQNGPNLGSAGWLTTPSGARRTPSSSPSLPHAAHLTSAHSTPLTRPRRAVALQPFPAGQAAIRNRGRGEKSCITHCQESHHTTSMDAQEGKSIKAQSSLKSLEKFQLFTGFPVCFSPTARLGGTKELFRFYRLNCRGPVTRRWEPFYSRIFHRDLAPLVPHGRNIPEHWTSSA